MKKQWKPKRLLTPDEMDELVTAVIERDGTTCIGKKLRDDGAEEFADHQCGSRRFGLTDSPLVTEAAHQVPQTFIKSQHLSDPELATEIAKDPDLCIPLCELLHTREPSLKPRERFMLVAHNADALEAAARKHQMFHRLNREFDYRFDEFKKEMG